MPQHKIAHIAREETDTALVERGLAGLDYDMTCHVCASHGEMIEAIKGDIQVARQVLEPT